jgi:hypothetical protein
VAGAAVRAAVKVEVAVAVAEKEEVAPAAVEKGAAQAVEGSAVDRAVEEMVVVLRAAAVVTEAAGCPVAVGKVAA